MFRQAARTIVLGKLAGLPPGTAPSKKLVEESTHELWNRHPKVLERSLEDAWDASPPDDELRPDLGNHPDSRRQGRGQQRVVGPSGIWDHWIYAYLVENTRLFDILRAVIMEFHCGERLEFPSKETRRWMRATEDLFFRPLPSGSIAALRSELRPDDGAIRRNGYYRMFGLPIDHGRPDGQPYAFPRPAAANTGFVDLFEDFLHEVWKASENFRNTSGANPTDDAGIASRAGDLAEMLTARRSGGNLSREEFVAVSTASWFHLVLESNNGVVTDLKAAASSPEERLRKIGMRVGIAPPRRAENFLALATPMSALLQQIELGRYSSSSQVPALYASPTSTTNPLRTNVLDIINQWSAATGHDLKAPRAASARRGASPIVSGSAASSPVLPAAAANGARTPLPIGARS